MYCVYVLRGLHDFMPGLFWDLEQAERWIEKNRTGYWKGSEFRIGKVTWVSQGRASLLGDRERRVSES